MKSRHFTETYIRSHITQPKYDIYLDKNFYYGEDPFKLPADDDWDPKTGTCAMHSLFTLNSLGIHITDKIKQYVGFKEVRENTIEHIINKLDKGSIIELLHTYKDKNKIYTMPRDNLYGSHDFIIVKGGDKYFLSQGFLFAYKHSLKAYTKQEVIQMLHDIIIHLCDYDNKKTWNDLDMSYYKKYFRTDLLVGGIKKLHVKGDRKVHNIILEYLEI